MRNKRLKFPEIGLGAFFEWGSAGGGKSFPGRFSDDHIDDPRLRIFFNVGKTPRKVHHPFARIDPDHRADKDIARLHTVPGADVASPVLISPVLRKGSAV